MTKLVRPIGDGNPEITPLNYHAGHDGQLHVTRMIFEDAPGEGEPHETVIESYLGIEISRRYTRYYPDGQDEFSCLTPGAPMSASDNLVTRFRRYPTGEFAGELRSVRRPDGTVSVYSYELVPGGKRTTVDSGVPDGAGEVVIDGIRTITTVNEAGTVTEMTELDLATGRVLDRFSVTTDEFGRALVTTYLDGTVKSERRDCCSVLGRTDRFGIETTIEEEELKLVEKREGVARITEELPSARPGGGKVVTVSRSRLDEDGNLTGARTLLMREEYDAASLLVASYSPPRNALVDPDADDLGARLRSQNQGPDRSWMEEEAPVVRDVG